MVSLHPRILTIRSTSPNQTVAALIDSLPYPPLLIDHPTEPRSIVNAWCGAQDDTNETAARLLHRARQFFPLPAAGDSALEHQWRAESMEGSGRHIEAVETARTLLSPFGVTAVQTVRAGLQLFRGLGLSELEIFRKIALIQSDRPILLRATTGMETLAATVRFVTSAVESSAGTRLILVVTTESRAQLRQQLDDHTMALLSQQITHEDPHPLSPPRDNLVSPQGEAPIAPDPGPPSASRFNAGGTELFRRAADSVKIAQETKAPPDSTEPPGEYAIARSLAEAALYAALQAHPRTTGLFALNADGGFTFGDRPAELDLLCRSLRIAIEVDGYFHFQDNTAYRRDRAKDFLMQAAGLIVLRFLAEDVTDRLDAVMRRVISAIDLRLGKPLEGLIQTPSEK